MQTIFLSVILLLSCNQSQPSDTRPLDEPVKTPTVGKEPENNNQGSSPENRQSGKKQELSNDAYIGLTVTDSELPECSASRQGQTIYLKSESSFKYCDHSAWLPIDLRGPNGDQGIAGIPGANGMNGTSGSQGPMGLQGLTGAQGPKGDPGSQGSAGLTGPAGYEALIETASEAAGENCGSGGTKLMVGVDNGHGGEVAGNHVLDPGEVTSTKYVCHGPTNFLKVYDRDGVARGYYVSNIVYPVGGSNILVFANGIILKHMTLDKFTIYFNGFARHIDSSPDIFPLSWNGGDGVSDGRLVRGRVGGPGMRSFPHYVAANCTGQAYLPSSGFNTSAYLHPSIILLMGQKNMIIAGSNNNYEVSMNSPAAGGSISTESSVIFSSYLNGDAVCSATSLSATGYPVTVSSTPTFPYEISAGWYLAP